MGKVKNNLSDIVKMDYSEYGNLREGILAGDIGAFEAENLVSFAAIESVINLCLDHGISETDILGFVMWNLGEKILDNIVVEDGIREPGMDYSVERFFLELNKMRISVN